MKKTINVNLAGRIFYVEEDAYPVLDTYLKEIKSHFEKFADSEEILKDIETRIAEQFLPQEHTTAPIVNIEAVQKVIAAMGSSRDFAETEEGLPEKPGSLPKTSQEARRRFYRNTDNAVLGGVASGIASYFDIDALWIRLAFVIATLTGGYGILIYIVFWIIVPAAETPSQKLEMKGDKLTLQALEQSVKQNIIDNPTAKKHATRAHGILREIVTGLGKFVARFGGVILRVIGSLVAIGLSFAIIGLIIGAFGIAFGSTSPSVDFPLRDFFGNGHVYLVLFLGFFIAFIPLLFGMLAGISLATMKNKFHPAPSIALIILWVLAIAGGTAVAARYAPRVQEFMETHPSFKVETTTRQVGAFTQLRVKNNIAVTIEPAQEFAVRVEATSADQARVRTEIVDGALEISEQHATGNRWCVFCIHKTPHIIISAPAELDTIAASNSASIYGQGLRPKFFTLTLSNSSTANLQLHTGAVKVVTENSSRATLRGEAVAVDARAQNASRIHALELFTPQVYAEASNSSSITVYASDQITAKSTNSSRIRYAGNPKHIEGNARPLDFPREDPLDTYEVEPVAPIEPVVPSYKFPGPPPEADGN